MTSTRTRRIPALLFAAAVTLLVSGNAAAQSAIAGQATDTSGAVLPGVTVEAASPSLIEGSRTGVTDGQGRYAIDNLRPGTYTVTFTLPGFATTIREGVELVSNFTAPVNAQLTWVAGRIGDRDEPVSARRCPAYHQPAGVDPRSARCIAHRSQRMGPGCRPAGHDHQYSRCRRPWWYPAGLRCQSRLADR